MPSQPDKEILERGIRADYRDEMILKSHPDNQHELTIPLRVLEHPKYRFYFNYWTPASTQTSDTTLDPMTSIS